MENENLKNLPPFYVGQKVVAIENQSQGAFKSGDEFVVKSITRPMCGCVNHWIVDVGVKSWCNLIRMTSCCSKTLQMPDSTWFFNANRFAPLQQQKYPLIKLTKVIEKGKVLLCEN